MASDDRNAAQNASAGMYDHSGGPVMRWCSTLGIGTMTFISVASVGAALCWSLQGLLGLPQWFATGGFIVFLFIGGWLGLWSGLRNWRVERRLDQGLEIDPPVFSLRGQLKNDPT